MLNKNMVDINTFSSWADYDWSKDSLYGGFDNDWNDLTPIFTGNENSFFKSYGYEERFLATDQKIQIDDSYYRLSEIFNGQWLIAVANNPDDDLGAYYGRGHINILPEADNETAFGSLDEYKLSDVKLLTFFHEVCHGMGYDHPTDEDEFWMDEECTLEFYQEYNNFKQTLA